MENELVKQNINSPAEMIRLAVSGGADLDKLEKLLALQERYEANEAKKAYSNALAIVNKNIPLVNKNSINTQTHSKYASLDNIICKTKEIYASEGFSVTFYEGVTDKPENVRVCADVLHKQGHKETYYFDIPMDGRGLKGNANMTAIHAKASSVAYARKYLMCLIWNIPTADNDGNIVVENFIDENKVSILKDLLTSLQVDEAKFLEYMEVEKVEDIPASKYSKAKIALEAKRKGRL